MRPHQMKPVNVNLPSASQTNGLSFAHHTSVAQQSNEFLFLCLLNPIALISSKTKGCHTMSVWCRSASDTSGKKQNKDNPKMSLHGVYNTCTSPEVLWPLDPVWSAPDQKKDESPKSCKKRLPAQLDFTKDWQSHSIVWLVVFHSIYQQQLAPNTHVAAAGKNSSLTEILTQNVVVYFLLTTWHCSVDLVDIYLWRINFCPSLGIKIPQTNCWREYKSHGVIKKLFFHILDLKPKMVHSIHQMIKNKKLLNLLSLGGLKIHANIGTMHRFGWTNRTQRLAEQSCMSRIHVSSVSHQSATQSGSTFWQFCPVRAIINVVDLKILTGQKCQCNFIITAQQCSCSMCSVHCSVQSVIYRSHPS